jgi:hypothetical protein
MKLRSKLTLAGAALARAALADADQTARHHAALVAAVRAGRPQALVDKN